MTDDRVRKHYDRLALLYRWFWGEHLHHGYYAPGPESMHQEDPRVTLIRELFTQSEAQPGSSVLDVGCGIGGSCFWLARERYCNVLGINISPVQLRIARHLARRRGLADSVRFALMDGQDLRIPDASLDLVWAVESTEHFGDKQRFIQESARVLKKGGRIALAAWLRGEHSESDGKELYGRILEGMLCPELLTGSEYLILLKDARFVDVKSRDISSAVIPTWDFAVRIGKRAGIMLLSRFLGGDVRRFVDTFPVMAAGYRTGAIGYGLITAQKAAV